MDPTNFNPKIPPTINFVQYYSRHSHIANLEPGEIGEARSSGFTNG